MMEEMIQVDKEQLQRIRNLAYGLNNAPDIDLRGDGSVTAGRRLERIVQLCDEIINRQTDTPDVDTPEATN